MCFRVFFFATTGYCIAIKLCLVSSDAGMKYESFVKIDDENPCELQCVSSTRWMTGQNTGEVSERCWSAVELGPSLTLISLIKSITDGTVPALLKSARVTSLYKCEDAVFKILGEEIVLNLLGKWLSYYYCYYYYYYYYYY